MSEPQLTKKKNKKKKKKSGNEQSVIEKTGIVESTEKEVLKTDTVISKALPQKVGVTTTFKDVEVTMTAGENQTVNGTGKKKKKKKKSKQQPHGDTEEPTDETENQNLLHFSENHIELVNHPEISVTISESPVVIPEKPPIKPPEKIEQPADNKKPAEKSEAPESVKKKKKKKKKKKNSDNAVPESTLPTAEPTEDVPSAPTYIKLPADGGNCVLLVSHENFSNGSKQTNNVNQESTGKSATVLLKKKDESNIVNNVHQDKPGVQNSSVSIFPVYSNSDKGKENKPDFNVASSLGKISDLIKNEDENLSKTNDSVSNTVESNNVEECGKSKAQLKAERRAIQEAQRAAKLAKNAEKDSTKSTEKNTTTSTLPSHKNINSKEQLSSKSNPATSETAISKEVARNSSERETCRKVQIFSHLPQYKSSIVSIISDAKLKIPSPVLELGTHYRKGTICGSNARCVGFLAALRQVIIDYKTPQNKSFWKELESKLQSYVDFLGNCRPLSVSIVNATKFLKHQMNHIPENTTEEKAKDMLCQSINNFVREEILLAKEAITISASAKIVNNDTILVFAYSSLVKDVLCKAHDQNKSFRVIIVDSRAKLEGLEMLRELVKHGLQCSYISINAISTVIKKVSKVVIGAHALLANGYVMSRLGCKILSLVSSVNSVPVLVCCETYKFWERSLTDSIVHNELGNPDHLINISLNKKDSLLKWQDLSSLHVYNLLYDVTPSELISVVITEKGLIPCSSVPVLLRVKHAGKQE